VPWKYGFKSIKSVVWIRLTNKMPATTWNQLAASEYGFYATLTHKLTTHAGHRPVNVLNVRRIVYS
jgi:sulfoxide reductase catalytic subunit YedY